MARRYMAVSTRLIPAAMLICTMAGPLAAQGPDTASKPEPFFTQHDAWLLAGFAAGAAVMAPLDKAMARTLQDEGLQESSIVKNGANFFKFMGNPAPQIISVAMYGLGKAVHSERAQKLAVHGFESLMLTNLTVGSIKVLAGRARPFVTNDSAAYDFKFMRGLKGRDYQSFPSGHTSSAFAVASAVTAETGHWIDESHGSPGLKLAIGLTMYGGASLVGISRVYHDQHWASDVAVGAAIGTFMGLKTVKYNYRHPKNILERTLVSTTVMPTSNGMVFAWHLPN